MNLKTDLADIRHTLPWLGFNDKDGRYGLKVVIFMILLLVLTTNCIMDVIFNWSDLDIRVDGLKGLFMYLFFGICLTSIVFDWSNTKSLIDIIDCRFYKFPFRMTDARIKLESRVEDELETLQSIWHYGRPIYTGSEILPPIIMLVFRILTTDMHNLRVDMLFTTHRYYWPEEQKSLPVYFLFLMLQTSFYLYIVKAGYVVHSSAFISMYLLAGEMRLLEQSMREIDIVVKDCDGNIDDALDCNNGTKNKKTTSLKLYLKHVLKHHQHIYRTAFCVNRGIRLFAFYLNSGSALLMVTAIYVTVQREGIMGKLQEVVYCCSMLLTSYLYNVMGQEVLVQDENLRKAIYQCEWVTKPQWFKKDLQIMMTRATKPIQMKPWGLFVLDFQNFLQILKAVYTLYNVLNNFKTTET